jgi:hypothetical protein
MMNTTITLPKSATQDSSILLREKYYKVGPNVSSPRVAWLMSYPNSGTSFTMDLVHKGGNKSVATNYGLECVGGSRNLPLYSNSPAGPYIINPNKTLPTEYILTKTHCGGRCVECGPEGYMENQTYFMSRCAQGSRKNNMHRRNKEIVWYDPHLVQRAIHIIRNPFDNLVSNFHLARHEHAKTKKNKWLIKYSNDITGFREWCFDQNAKYSEREKLLLPKDVVNFFEEQDIPCHAHFFKFAKVSILSVALKTD